MAIGSRDPKYDAEVNVGGVFNVLEAAVKAGTRKVLFASSAATYGDVDAMPVNENYAPQRPVSPYGITKMVTEHSCAYFQLQHGLDYTVFRYGNVYGPRQDPNGEAGVIAIFLGKFLQKQGVRIDSDGEQTRDYVNVADVVRANVIGLTQGSGETYVIGTGKKTSVNRILPRDGRRHRLRGAGDARAAPRRRRARGLLRSGESQARAGLGGGGHAGRRHAPHLRVLAASARSPNAPMSALRLGFVGFGPDGQADVPQRAAAPGLRSACSRTAAAWPWRSCSPPARSAPRARARSRRPATW